MTQAKTTTNAGNSGKDVAVKQPVESLVAELASVAQLDAENGATNGKEIGARVVSNMMAATTLDELFNAADAGLQSLKDSKYIGRRVGIMSVEYRKGDDKYADGGLGTYVVMSLVDDEGETDTVGCGATNVVAFCRLAQKMGHIREESPLWVVFKSKETMNGELLTVSKP